MGKFSLRLGAVAVVVSFTLAACGGSDAPAPAAEPVATPATPAEAPAPQATAPAPVLVEGAGSIEVAEAALREQRLFTPAGDNAFELFALAMQRDPESQRIRDALTDLFPYAVLHVEQRTAARDAAEARRVLELMKQVQPEAPALDRLEREIERLERRIAADEAAQQQAAARANAPAPPPPTPAPAAPTPAPTPAPTTAVEPTTPPPPAPAPAQQAPAAAPAPAPVQAPATPAEPRLPRVLRQPPLRYPDQAMRQGLEGRVTVEFVVNTDGSVSEVRVVDATPSNVFDREAMAVVRRTRFEPPSEPIRARRTVEFKLD